MHNPDIGNTVVQQCPAKADEAYLPSHSHCGVRIRQPLNRRRLLPLPMALVMAGCSTLNPQIISKDLILGRTTSNDWSCTVGSNPTPDPADQAFDARLAEVFGQVNALRNDYLCAVKEQTALPNYIGAALIPLTAVSLYRGITASSEGTQKWLAAAGITGAAAYAYGSTYTSKPRTLVYLAGADALGCAVLATRPYLYMQEAATPLAQPKPQLTAVAANRAAQPEIGAADKQNEGDIASPQEAKVGASVCRAASAAGNKATLLTQRISAVQCELERVRGQLEPLRAALSRAELTSKECAQRARETPQNSGRSGTALKDQRALAQDAAKRQEGEKRDCEKSERHKNSQAMKRLLTEQVQTVEQAIEPHEKLIRRGKDLQSRVLLAADELREKANAIQFQVAAEVLKAQPELSNIMQTTDALRANAFRFSAAKAFEPKDAVPAVKGEGSSAAPVDTSTEPAIKETQEALASLSEAARPLIALLEQADSLSQRVGNVAQCRFDATRINGLLSIAPDDDEVSMTAGGVYRWALVGNGRLPQYSFGGAAPKDTTLSLADQAGQPAVVLSVPEAAEETQLSVVFADPGGVARRTVRVNVKPRGNAKPNPPAARTGSAGSTGSAEDIIAICKNPNAAPSCLDDAAVKAEFEACAKKIGVPNDQSRDQSNPALFKALVAAKGVGSQCVKP